MSCVIYSSKMFQNSCFQSCRGTKARVLETQFSMVIWARYDRSITLAYLPLSGSTNQTQTTNIRDSRRFYLQYQPEEIIDNKAHITLLSLINIDNNQNIHIKISIDTLLIIDFFGVIILLHLIQMTLQRKIKKNTYTQ